MDFDIDARLAGYGWDEISAFVSGRSQEARDAGYSDEEIDAFLERPDPADEYARREASWRGVLAQSDQPPAWLRAAVGSTMLTPLETPAASRIAAMAQREVPPAEMPAPNAKLELPDIDDDFVRNSYGNDLIRGAAQDPGTWAERFAASLWGADGDANPTALVRAAASIAARFPTQQDFTDLAIGVAGAANLLDGEETDSAAVREVRDGLIDRWAEQGGPPLDKLYRDAIDNPPRPPEVSPWAEALIGAPVAASAFWDQTIEGATNVGIEAARLAAHSGLLDAILAPINLAYQGLEAAGLPVEPIPDPTPMLDAVMKERLRSQKEDPGYLDGWPRWAGEIAVTLPMFSTLGLAGGWAVVAAGATGGAAAGAFTPSDAENYWEQKAKDIALNTVGGAALAGGLLGIGKVISKMAPEAAEMLRRIVGDMGEPRVRLLDPEQRSYAPEYVYASEALRVPKPAEPAPVVAAADGTVTPPKPGQFVPEATPAERMQALARDLGDTPPSPDPRFFEKLAADQDPATQELARSMDGARGYWNYMLDLGGRIMRDETGAMPNPFRSAWQATMTTAEDRRLRAAYVSGRDYVQPLLRSSMGPVERQLSQYGHMIDYAQTSQGGSINLHRLVNAHMNEWRKEVEKGPAGAPMKTMIGDMIQYIEGRSNGAVLRADSPLQPVADTIRAINMHLRNHMEMAQQRGLHDLKSYYENYFRHMWKDPNAVDRAFGVGRQGAAHSFQFRSIPTIADGLMKGLEPKMLNPIELTMYDAAEKLRYLKTLDMLDAATQATNAAGESHVYYARQPRAGTDDVRLNGVGTTRLIAIPGPVKAQNDLAFARVQRDRIVQSMREVRANPNTTPGEKAQALANFQALLAQTRADIARFAPLAAPKAQELHAYASRGFALSYNRNIDTGFFSQKHTSELFERLNYAKNITTQGQLMLPFFHAQTMITETIAGGLGNALTEIGGAARLVAQGHLKRAGIELGHAAKDIATFGPVNFVRTLYQGDRGLRMYRDMQQDRVINLLTEANARFGPRQDIYRFGRAPTIGESIRRGSLGEEYRAQLRYLIGDPKTETLPYRIAQVPLRRMWGFLGHEAGRVLNSSSGWLFDWVIPRLKIGTNMQMMQTYLRQNPTASHEQVMHRARQIVDNTDARLGEMNMDNIFWSRTAKQVAQTMMISPGWVYGSLRFFSGAAGYNLERRVFEFNPASLSTLMAFVGTYAIQNSLTQYFMNNGQLPWETGTPLRDMAGFRTGALTPEGVPERGIQPSQIKELYDYGKIIAHAMHDPMSIPQGIAHYGLSKMPGIWQIARGLVTGEDAIGHHIDKTPGGWFGFFLKNLTPIFASSMNERKAGTGLEEWQSFIGWRNIPSYAENPERFFKGLEAVDLMRQRDEYRRGVRENRRYETPRELPPKPPPRGGGRTTPPPQGPGGLQQVPRRRRD